MFTALLVVVAGGLVLAFRIRHDLRDFRLPSPTRLRSGEEARMVIEAYASAAEGVYDGGAWRIARRNVAVVLSAITIDATAGLWFVAVEASTATGVAPPFLHRCGWTSPWLPLRVHADDEPRGCCRTKRPVHVIASDGAKVVAWLEPPANTDDLDAILAEVVAIVLGDNAATHQPARYEPPHAGPYR